MADTQVLDSLQRLQGQIASLNKSRAEYTTEITSLTSQLEQTNKHSETIESAQNIIRVLMAKLSEQGKTALSRLLTDALSIVFPDRQYKITLMIEDARGLKTLDFFLEENVNGELIQADIRSDVGGSVMTVIALVTQVFYIKYTQTLPIMFID